VRNSLKILAASAALLELIKGYTQFVQDMNPEYLDKLVTHKKEKLEKESQNSSSSSSDPKKEESKSNSSAK
jgi:hypothetical protein